MSNKKLLGIVGSIGTAVAAAVASIPADEPDKIEMSALEAKVDSNTVALARIEGKIDTAIELLK